MNQDLYTNQFSYYSGSQITVWFGNIFIDDIFSIQWVRTQNKMPIYGYASKNFDSVANGTVLIQGNFVINFRQHGYMAAIMSSIKSLYAAFSSSGSTNTAVWATVQNLIAQHLANGTFGPQSVDDIIALGNSEDFFAVAEQYQNAVWGQAATEGCTMSPADVQQSNDIPNGFDILISYGSPPTSDHQTAVQMIQSTTKTLNGVHLVGESQVVQIGGQPVQEQYSFIARETDATINV